MEISTAYWEVRRAISIVAFFGGLRLAETQDLCLEKIVRGPDGFSIIHSRKKQRSDKLSTKFLIPQEGGYADQLAVYLDKVKFQLNKFTGKVWYTGRKTDLLVSQTMGKNKIAEVPHEIAKLLKLPDPSMYTFHSFRRSSASMAADSGATSEQMMSFFNWKHPSMCQEYISTSKAAIKEMATKLSSTVKEKKKKKVENCVEGNISFGDWTGDNDEDFDRIIAEVDGGLHQDHGKIVGNVVQNTIAAVSPENGINIKVFFVNNMSGNIN